MSLTTTIELFNREVVGHAMADHLRADYAAAPASGRWPPATAPISTKPRAASGLNSSWHSVAWLCPDEVDRR